MSQDDLLTYPFVRKEEFGAIQLENNKLREQIDVMYAEFNQLKGFLDMGMLDINTLIEYSIGKKTKATEDEIAKVEKRLKDISNIDKLSKLTSDNIKYKVELNDKDKTIIGLMKDVGLLKQELNRIVDEQTKKEEKDKKTIVTLRNLDDNMKQKLKENEQLEYRNDELKKLNNSLHDDLTKKAYYKLINKKLRKIKRLIKSKFMKARKMERAKHILFEVKQSIALMSDSKDKQFLQDETKAFDEVLNG